MCIRDSIHADALFTCESAVGARVISVLVPVFGADVLDFVFQAEYLLLMVRRHEYLEEKAVAAHDYRNYNIPDNMRFRALVSYKHLVLR